MSATPATSAPSTRTREKGKFAPAPIVLATTPIGFVVLIAISILAVELSGIPELSAASSEQLGAIPLLLGVRGLVFLLAFGWGAAGIVLLASRLRPVGGSTATLATLALAAAGLSVANAVAQAVIPVATASFTADRYGDTVAYDVYWVTTALATWLGVVATAFAALAVRQAGIRPTAMVVIAAICVAYVVADATTRGGIPPFGIMAVWVALGVLLRSSRVPA